MVVDRTVPASRAVAETIGCRFIEADLGTAADCRRLVAETVAAFGTVHVLVNNAGFSTSRPSTSSRKTCGRALLATMLTAPFLLTKTVWQR